MTIITAVENTTITIDSLMQFSHIQQADL